MMAGYLIIINIIAFYLYGVDKRKARKGKWRIPENTLLGVALIGGSLGALLGMYLFHHKTSKPQFAIGFPIILAIHILLYFLK